MEPAPVRNNIRSHLHRRCLARQDDIRLPAASPSECISDRDNHDICTLKIYSSRDLDTLLHELEVVLIYIGKYTGIYTIATIA